MSEAFSSVPEPRDKDKRPHLRRRCHLSICVGTKTRVYACILHRIQYVVRCSAELQVAHLAQPDGLRERRIEGQRARSWNRVARRGAIDLAGSKGAAER